MNPLEIEIAISALHSTGDYVVLRRLNLETDPRFTRRTSPNAKIALCLDTETTGLNPSADKVIELGIVAFEYNPDTGEIIRITDRYSGFEDPGMPLSKEITEITGITDEMVANQEFADEQVNILASKASLVIAHNAGFDRRFVEKRFPAFIKLPWACSVSQINWDAERIKSRSLEFVLLKCGGHCINAHRALEDAEGVLGLLLGTLPVSNAPVFKTLLDKAFESTSRIIAVGSPFETKDILKERGYRWSDGSRGGVKAWWTVVSEEDEQKELKFLAKEIYPGGNTKHVVIKRIDAVSRFSVREE
ncbi:DNA polymerase III PolC-type [Geobacter sp. OR-1]|uniref:3'-5' exonuclease n=1 Tax=Geobacter sp. OR-1 TaxID=1266765 RepID=UPI000542E8E5|nr:3'-5' exonuclease [Geobacter sp. OR-1]GAM10416.1 DNA polymerase III PolC-type [Geobacter sp. OR-1]